MSGTKKKLQFNITHEFSDIASFCATRTPIKENCDVDVSYIIKSCYLRNSKYGKVLNINIYHKDYKDTFIKTYFSGIAYTHLQEYFIQKNLELNQENCIKLVGLSFKYLGEKGETNKYSNIIFEGFIKNSKIKPACKIVDSD